MVQEPFGGSQGLFAAAEEAVRVLCCRNLGAGVGHGGLLASGCGVATAGAAPVAILAVFQDQ
jgi:hypothetical protein